MFIGVAFVRGSLMLVTLAKRRRWLSGHTGHRWVRALVVFGCVGLGHPAFAVVLRVIGVW